jgi:hypothetical protein
LEVVTAACSSWLISDFFSRSVMEESASTEDTSGGFFDSIVKTVRRNFRKRVEMEKHLDQNGVWKRLINNAMQKSPETGQRIYT